MKKIVLITSFPPEGGAGGGVILRTLLDKIESSRLHWIILNNDRTVEKNWRPQINRYLPILNVPGLRFDVIYFIKKFFLNYFILFVELSRLTYLKIKFRPELIWLVIDKDEIFLLYYLAKFSGLPWHLTIHDDPEVSLKLAGKKYFESDELKFEFLIRNATSVDCISNRMSNYYQKKFGVDSIVLTRTISSSTLEANKSIDKLSNNKINIIMGGWGDCPEPWPECLIEAIELLEKISKKDVKFYAFDPKFKEFNDSRFIYCERMNSEEFDLFLNKMDIGYAPDPLELEYRLFAQTSLSTKIVTYLSATIPIFYHGPQDSSIGEIFNRFKAGVIVESNNPKEIAIGLFELITNYSTYRSNSINLASNDFDETKLKNRLNLIIN